MKWPKRRKRKGWYCNTGIACFHRSLSSALWHNWKGWDSDDPYPRAPWERLLLYRVWHWYVNFRNMEIQPWQAARAAWRMLKLGDARGHLDLLERKHEDIDIVERAALPDIIAARRAIQDVEQRKPPITWK